MLFETNLGQICPCEDIVAWNRVGVIRVPQNDMVYLNNQNICEPALRLNFWPIRVVMFCVAQESQFCVDPGVSHADKRHKKVSLRAAKRPMKPARANLILPQAPSGWKDRGGRLAAALSRYDLSDSNFQQLSGRRNRRDVTPVTICNNHFPWKLMFQRFLSFLECKKSCSMDSWSRVYLWGKEGSQWHHFRCGATGTGKTEGFLAISTFAMNQEKLTIKIHQITIKIWSP